ncbi:hypothetical protein V6M85_09720 [Sulfolobus tengchongensis]|uniref:Uncharacterized protein n=1 Tax=Sulfolobus tengchongensis TaxID=207809 RepID=A0AAX4KXY7_9CREN
MIKIRIPKEWYEILRKLALDRRISINQLISELITTEECLNLPYVEPTTYKQLNVSISIEYKYSSTEVENKIKHFLFCR